jgi:TatA/E family protein of Tat protein translocase
MPFGIQPIHILIIIVVAFLLFGATKLPEMGRSLGRTINEFKKGTKEAAEGFREETQNNAPTPSAPAAESSSSPARSFCIQCGAPNPPEARFCASCGAKLPEKIA